MASKSYKYIIIGAGLAGVSAAEGIREIDAEGEILLVGAEKEQPYDRPPLSKQLWTGAKSPDEIRLHNDDFYQRHRIQVRLGQRITQIEPASHFVRDGNGNTFDYERLLLATGGTPRRLNIPGGDDAGICYFRTLDDFRRLHGAAAKGKAALVIGGGFIGSEIAAALCMNGVAVTMLFPSPWLVARVFPEKLGRHLTEYYRAKGVEILSGDAPVSTERRDSGYLTRTRGGREIGSDLIVAGIGITPNIALAQAAALATAEGIIVNEFLQTSNPDIYAAGDVALSPGPIFGPRRVEHWDNAANQGKHAGRNMAGSQQPFTYLPFFFSDLFEFGYEAVGDVDSRHTTFADWHDENKTGVIYYLQADRVRGVMLCNVWEKVPAARQLIEANEPVTTNALRGAIR